MKTPDDAIDFFACSNQKACVCISDRYGSHMGSGTISLNRENGNTLQIRYERRVMVKLERKMNEATGQKNYGLVPIYGTSTRNGIQTFSPFRVIKGKEHELKLKSGTSYVRVYVAPSSQYDHIKSILSRCE